MMDTTGNSRTTEPSAADRVYGFVKDGIVARRFHGEDLLSEGQIAEAVGVSRTPVREGLLRLEVEGLVRLLPKRGALVVPVTADEIADVLETRRLVESHTARVVAQTGLSPVLMEHLAAHLSEMRAAMTRGDTPAYVRADRAFHAEIVAAAGNRILTGLYESLRDRQLRMGVVNLLDDGDGTVDRPRMRQTLTEHKRILDALTAGSVRAVETAVREHLTTTEHVLGRRR